MHRTVFSDRSGYLSSTDLGLSFGGKIPHDCANCHAAFVSGEGRKRPEWGKHKDFHLRVTSFPLAKSRSEGKNLFVSGFASTGSYDDVTASPRDRNRAPVQIRYWQAGAVCFDAGYLRWIVGVSHRWSPNLRALPDYENVKYDSGAGKADEERISLRAEVTF